MKALLLWLPQTVWIFLILLLCVGRFDLKCLLVVRTLVGVRNPQCPCQNKSLGDDVDLRQIAQTTAGFTGADLENLLNEAQFLPQRVVHIYR